MSIILNVRGPNGSGKSTLVRRLLGPEPLSVAYHETKVTYSRDRRVAALGHYLTPTGGCDGISQQDTICKLVAALAPHHETVIFEGVIVSTLFGRYRDLDHYLTALGHTYVWLFLDYDRAECLRRIYARNGGKPIKEYKIDEKINCVESCKRRALEAGLFVLPSYRP